MSLYKVIKNPVTVRGTVFDNGQTVELSDEELNNIGSEYFEKVEGAGESEPTPPSGEGEGEGSQNIPKEGDACTLEDGSEGYLKPNENGELVCTPKAQE